MVSVCPAARRLPPVPALTSRRYLSRVSVNRKGVTDTIVPVPVPTKEPTTSTCRSVAIVEYTQICPLVDSGTIARLLFVTPARGLMFDTSGRPMSHGYTVTQPVTAGFHAVTLRATAVALLGMPVTLLVTSAL